MSQYIKAPFNFVPLNDKVYFPQWASQISHDLPFSDGVSGSLEIRIKAETPIFVRNGYSKKKDGKSVKNEDNTFSHIGDGEDMQYFIPGTTMKGVIRNVLEIMSFGKLSKYSDDNFYIRDLGDKEYRTRMAKEHCGWLYKDEEGKYYIDDCGEPIKFKLDKEWLMNFAEKHDISLRAENKALGEDIINSLVRFADQSKEFFKDDENKRALRKYEIIYKILTGKTIGKASMVRCDDDDIFFSFEDYTLILTGQSSRAVYDQKKKKPKASKTGEQYGCWTGKIHEYLFGPRDKTIPVPDEVFKAFASIHRESADYAQFWKERLHERKRIPVFFSLDAEELHSIGLTALYKYPTLSKVSDGISKDHMTDKLDLAECLFGNTSDKDALKGRISFGACFAEGNPICLPEKKVVLSSPHPSYFPIYVGKGKSWDSAEFDIAGRKRYMGRNIMDNNCGTDNVSSTITPLDAGTAFYGKISYHNLRSNELGALIAAITFLGNDKCFHGIGSGKPLGYGKASIKIINMPESSIKNYMDAFRTMMSEFDANWAYSVQLRELIAIAQGIPIGNDSKFTYMHMDTTADGNEFKKGTDAYTKDGQQLGLFTEILSGTIPNIAYEKAMTINQKLEWEARKKRQLRIQEELESKRIADEEAQKLKEQEEKKRLEQERLSSEAQEISDRADELYRNRGFEQALALYKEANYIYKNDYTVNQIKLCKIEISKNELPIAEFITPVASHAALAGKLKKWIANHGTLTDSQLTEVGEIIEKAFKDFNNANKKNWRDAKKWKPIIDIVGEDIVTEWIQKIN